MPRSIELFAGTGSVDKAFNDMGWEVVSVNNCAKFSPDILVDLLECDHTVYPPGSFEVAHASPLCTQYSCARTVGPPRDLEGADKLVQRALDIIEYFKPKYWWLENAATGLLHTRPCVQHLEKPYEAHCCMYGAPYKKATHLWSNCPTFGLGNATSAAGGGMARCTWVPPSADQTRATSSGPSTEGPCTACPDPCATTWHMHPARIDPTF